MSKIYIALDDNEIDLFITQKMILMVDPEAKIFTFSDHYKFLFFLQEINNSKDELVFFIDLRMTGIDGFQVIDKIQAHIINRGKLYLLSSTIDSLDFQKAHAHPVITDILTKPLSLFQLKNIVGI